MKCLERLSVVPDRKLNCDSEAWRLKLKVYILASPSMTVAVVLQEIDLQKDRQAELKKCTYRARVRQRMNSVVLACLL